jgi:hypothetical protein
MTHHTLSLFSHPKYGKKYIILKCCKKRFLPKNDIFLFTLQAMLRIFHVYFYSTRILHKALWKLYFQGHLNFYFIKNTQISTYSSNRTNFLFCIFSERIFHISPSLTDHKNIHCIYDLKHSQESTT